MMSIVKRNDIQNAFVKAAMEDALDRAEERFNINANVIVLATLRKTEGWGKKKLLNFYNAMEEYQKYISMRYEGDDVIAMARMLMDECDINVAELVKSAKADNERGKTVVEVGDDH